MKLWKYALIGTVTVHCGVLVVIPAMAQQSNPPSISILELTDPAGSDDDPVISETTVQQPKVTRESAQGNAPTVLPTAPRSVKRLPQNGDVPDGDALGGDALGGDALGGDALGGGSNRGTGPEKAGNPATEIVRQRFENGAINIERTVAEDAAGNFVNHGAYVQYNIKGEVVVSGSYQWGKRHGEWTQQIPADAAQRLHGSLDKGFTPPFVSKASFANDKLNGTWAIVDGRGKIALTWEYANGNRDGNSVYFDSHGKVLQSLTYRANLVEDISALAEARKEVQLYNGKLVRRSEEWYPGNTGKNNSRQLKTQESLLVPFPLNVLSSDWDNHQVVYQQSDTSKPVRHGRTVTFYPNGNRESEGNYDQGKRNGTFAWWYSNGQQKVVGEYRDDREHGLWSWWHDNGLKEATGNFLDGKQVEEWSSWNQMGQLISRGIPKAANGERSQVANRPEDDNKR
ncbi:MAG: hypothetical protein R3C53_18840 [Pirellulaceae bacterium]